MGSNLFVMLLKTGYNKYTGEIPVVALHMVATSMTTGLGLRPGPHLGSAKAYRT